MSKKIESTDSHDDISYWLALLRTPGIDYKTFHNILAFYPNLKDFFNLSEMDYHHHNFPSKTIHHLRNPNWEGVEADLEWACEQNTHYILNLNHANYPKLLRELHYPPPIFFINGTLEVFNYPQLAIVGSRQPSPGGTKIAHQLAEDLATAGFIITSGLALGIDTCAHLGALCSNKTIAVIGTGINLYYPKQNRRLAERISENGGIISEFPTGTPPYSLNFPRRNRVLSGLSLGTVVVEANLKSGSLITARQSLDQGREVFAVPGSVYNPRARGCHALLKQGAKLVESYEDILEELPYYHKKIASEPVKSAELAHKRLDADHLKLLECVGYEPTKLDVLVVRSHFPIQKVTSILVDLELAGYISSAISGYMRVS